MTTVAISGMVGVVIGVLVRDSFGGKRSSIGVHRSDGRLVSFWPGVFLFATITILGSFFTTAISSALTDMMAGLPAFILVLFIISLLISQSYSR